MADGKSAYEIALQEGFEGTAAQWLASLRGDRGFTGLAGPAGDTGPRGFQGDPGEQGNPGLQGEKGERGDVGIQGTQGIQGVAGTTGACGKSAYELAISSGYVGTQVQWLLSLRGSRGLQGIQGDQGIPGIQGEPGIQGNQGVRGDQGIQGERGIPGLPGHQGEPGPRGEFGAQGVQGEQGAPGLQGPAGLSAHELAQAHGYTGDLGTWLVSLKGAKGDPGERGIQGVPGEPGLPGAPGINGTDGAPGLRGEQGIPGDRGEPGDRGYPGQDGQNGQDGRQGEQGPQGIQGEQGLRGESGERGVQGDPGPRGADADLSDPTVVQRISYDGAPLLDLLDQAKTFSTLAALMQYRGSATVAQITQGKIAGFFYRDDTDTTSEVNVGTVVRDAEGRCWNRLYEFGRVRAAWFGVRGIGAPHDDSDAFQRVLDHVGVTREAIDGGAGEFWITKTLRTAEDYPWLDLRFDGADRARLVYTAIPAGQSLFQIGAHATVPDEYPAVHEISGAYFVGSAQTQAAEIHGADGQRFRHCRFGANAVGLVWCSEDSHSLSQAQAIDCDFDLDCNTAQAYRSENVTVPSLPNFFGCGIVGGTVSSEAPATTLVSAGSYLFAAPFSPAVALHQQGSALVRNEGSANSSFLGTPQVHAFAADTAFGDDTAQHFWHLGGFIALNSFGWGAALQTPTLVIDQSAVTAA